MAPSIPAYYQESGRAGRDGLPAFCRVYHNKATRKSIDFILNQEKNAAKTKQKEDQSKAVYKAYELMVDLLENARCRHWSLAQYFGDEKPDCRKNCDVCKDYTSVSRAISDFHSARDYQKFGLTNSADYIETFGELYGEGRGGISKNSEEYSNEVTDRFGADPLEKKDTELINTIKEQFALRRGDSNGKDDDTGAQYASVKAAEATKIKVAGLSVQTRESYVKYFKDLLKKNWLSSHDRAFNFTDKDFEEAAIDVEYGIFSESKVNATYKKKIAYEVAELRKMTSKSQPHPLILKGRHQSDEKPQTLGRLMESIESDLEKAKVVINKDEDSQNSTSSNHRKGCNGSGFSSAGDAMRGGFMSAGDVMRAVQNEERKKSSEFVTAGDVMKLLATRRSSQSNEEDEDDQLTSRVPNGDDTADNIAVHSMSESEDEDPEKSCFIEDNSALAEAASNCGMDPVGLVDSVMNGEIPDTSTERENDSFAIDEPYSPSSEMEIVLSPKDPPTSPTIVPAASETDSPDKPSLKRKYDSLFGDDSSLEDNPTATSPKSSSKVPESPRKQAKHSNSKRKHKKRRHSESEMDKKVREAKKKEFSDVVVKYLMPYYKKRRITNKDSFKVLARKIVHTLLPKENEYGESEIKQYIHATYKKGLFKRSLLEIEKSNLTA